MIALGLASRSGSPLIPSWLARNAGDALWTMAVYGVLAWLWPRAKATHLAWGALAISFAVECSQLVSAQWLAELRRTLAGRLLLGQGWQSADLLRYGAGAALAYAFDRRLGGG